MDYVENLLNNLSTQFGNHLPRVLGALLVLLLGLFIAKIARRLVKAALGKTTVDDKIAAKLNTGLRMDDFIAKLVYYVVLIYVLLVVLSMLGVEGVLEPLQDMLNKFVGFVPNVIAAGIIGFAGYIISSLGSEATGFLSQKLEGFGERIGLQSSSISLNKIVKQVVFILLFIPILIIALDTLNMDAISKPATEMLSQMLNALPQVIAAVILLTVFYIVGKYIVSILAELLSNMGVDNLASNLGVSNMIGGASVSKLIGNVLLFFIMFTGVIAAADKLNLTEVQGILNNVMSIAGRVFFGLVILMAGMLISNFASSTLSKSKDSGYLVPLARFAIIGIFLAFALHTMGIAESIVNLAFGLTLGAVAVAFALSFGLGGRKAAGKQMERFFEGMNARKENQN